MKSVNHVDINPLSWEKIYSTVGIPIMVNVNEDATTVITHLRDAVATMKYEQMETCGVHNRTNADKSDFEMLIKVSLDEYPTFNCEYEEMCVFKNNKG